MIGHRCQLLRFEHILSTYEQILGGGEKATRYFLAEEYAEMRRKSPLGIALHVSSEYLTFALNEFLVFFNDTMKYYLPPLSVPILLIISSPTTANRKTFTLYDTFITRNCGIVGWTCCRDSRKHSRRNITNSSSHPSRKGFKKRNHPRF